MSKGIDIVDVMLAVRKGELKILVSNGFFLLQNVKSGEAVRLNEAEPVRHGRWRDSNFIPGMLTCTNCGAQRNPNFKIGGGAWCYCPNCGAKMNKEEA